MYSYNEIHLTITFFHYLFIKSNESEESTKTQIHKKRKLSQVTDRKSDSDSNTNTVPKIKRRLKQWGSIRKPDPPDSEEEDEEEDFVPQEPEQKTSKSQQTISYPPNMLREDILNFVSSFEAATSMKQKIELTNDFCKNITEQDEYTEKEFKNKISYYRENFFYGK